MVRENVRTIGKVKRTHIKFGKLAQVTSANPSNGAGEEDNYASLLPSSEEETEDEDLENYSDLDPEWSSTPPVSVSNSKFSLVGGNAAGEANVEWRNPYADLTSETASEAIRGSVQTLLAHKGFDGELESQGSSRKTAEKADVLD